MTVVIDCNIMVMCLTSRSPLKNIPFPNISVISIDEFTELLKGMN
jgi:hypothetical protein